MLLLKNVPKISPLRPFSSNLNSIIVSVHVVGSLDRLQRRKKKKRQEEEEEQKEEEESKKVEEFVREKNKKKKKKNSTREDHTMLNRYTM